MEIKNQLALLVLVTSFVNVPCYQVKDAPLLKSRPNWLKVCKRNSPDKNDCINNMFASMFPYLGVGIPEINVDPFEPLPLDKVSISKGSGAITLAGNLSGLNVTGSSKAVPTYSNFSEDQQHWNFTLEIPFLDIKSEYNLKGNILVLPLLGHGTCEIKLYDIKTNVTTDMSFIKKENREVINIDNMKVRFTVSKMKVKFQNLFNGNKILGQTVNTFINQNAIEIIEELEESIGESLATILTDLMNNIFNKIPLDLFYLNEEQYKKYLQENKD